MADPSGVSTPYYQTEVIIPQTTLLQACDASAHKLENVHQD